MPPDCRFAYATRLNGFKADAANAFPARNRVTALDLVERAAAVPGLSARTSTSPTTSTA